MCVYVWAHVHSPTQLNYRRDVASQYHQQYKDNISFSVNISTHIVCVLPVLLSITMCVCMHRHAHVLLLEARIVCVCRDVLWGAGENWRLTSFPLITQQQSPLIVRASHAFDVFKYPAAWSHAREAGKWCEEGQARIKANRWISFQVLQNIITCWTKNKREKRLLLDMEPCLQSVRGRDGAPV